MGCKEAGVLSNHCQACSTGPKPSDPNYKDWSTKHKPVCQNNHDSSSNSMEAQAATTIFQRSCEKRKLVYETDVRWCEGFVAANKQSGYDIPVLKEDCINHIAKRMLNGLEANKKANRDKLNRKLIQTCIKKIMNTYAT